MKKLIIVMFAAAITLFNVSCGDSEFEELEGRMEREQESRNRDLESARKYVEEADKADQK